MSRFELIIDVDHNNPRVADNPAFNPQWVLDMTLRTIFGNHMPECRLASLREIPDAEGEIHGPWVDPFARPPGV
jgi:hypothetical protein